MNLLVKLSSGKAERFLLFGGSITSHIVILARSIGIPVIFSDDEALLGIAGGSILIPDAFQGSVIVNPSKEVFDHYHELSGQQRLFISISSLSVRVKRREKYTLWHFFS